MANKRMFSKEIVQSDRFLELSKEAQLVYFQLGMSADDEGFVGSPRRICRTCDCSEKNLDELEKHGFIITFDSGVIVISDWKLNNNLQNDRFKETIYVEERQSIKEVYKRYVCIQDVSKLYTQQNREQINTDQQNQTESNLTEPSAWTPQELQDICKREHIKLDSIKIIRFVQEMQETDWKVSGETIKDIGKVLRSYEKKHRTDESFEEKALRGAALGFDD